MTKTLQQIKDEYAYEHKFEGWADLQDYYIHWDNEKLENAIDQVAIRYAEEQNKQLQEWKESMMTIHNELDLQGIGDALGLKLGSSIAPEVLPKINELVDRNRELMEMLQQLKESLDDGIKTVPKSNFHNRLNELINSPTQI